MLPIEALETLDFLRCLQKQVLSNMPSVWCRQSDTSTWKCVVCDLILDTQALLCFDESLMVLFFKGKMTTTSNFSQEASILFQLQPEIQLQGNEPLGHSDKKAPNPTWVWTGWFTSGLSECHPMKKHYKPGISVLIHGVNLGSEATVSCPNY